MIDHLTLTVREMARARPFYERVLGALGYRVLMEFGEMCGFGDDKPVLWMKPGDPPTTPQHLAFVARTRADVDAFHAAALAAGARDNGGPGLRTDYHPTYYAAFVIDPEGHNLEAVTHRAEGAAGRRAKLGAAARKAKPRVRKAKAPARKAKPRKAARRR